MKLERPIKVHRLSMQPPGPVILLGHSMGGFLAAEAATDISNNPGGYPGARPHRIVGVIAFDTPYLGMHPHVVVSGIASLVPKEEKKTTAGQMNDNSLVHIVDDNVTDHWESYKTDMYGTNSPLLLKSLLSTELVNLQVHRRRFRNQDIQPDHLA